ncbi:late control protein, partial [Brevibacillus parabrevis]
QSHEKEKTGAEGTPKAQTGYTGGRTQKELDDLAGDPSHGGKIRDQGLKEREIGLDLEQQGKLGKIVRDPQGNGGAEFIDTTNNVKWDVKSFVSYPNGHTSPKKGAFTVNNGMKAINKELDKNYNVIVDKRDMIPEHVEQLKEAIEKAGISDRIIWYP